MRAVTTTGTVRGRVAAHVMTDVATTSAKPEMAARWIRCACAARRAGRPENEAAFTGLEWRDVGAGICALCPSAQSVPLGRADGVDACLVLLVVGG